MTRPDPTHLGARFEVLLDRREQELLATVIADSNPAAHAHDRTEVVDQKDLAEDDVQAMLDETISASAAAELKAIAAARRRIAAGTYGQCLACGEAIDEQRLLAVPAAALCMTCQTGVEGSGARKPSRT